VTQAPGHRRPFVIGVTGNIASGKSSVLRRLAELGAKTIDADRVYHDLIQPGLPLWSALVQAFGDEIVGIRGEIDRGALAALAFGDPARLATLDRITHPAVIAEIERLIAASDAPVLAVDAVKLIESGMKRLCDAVWLVEAPATTRIERLIDRNGLSRAEAERRVAAHPDSPAKRDLADAVIANDGSLDALRAKVDAAWSDLPALSNFE
jgi:dephospho-CoA kinase